MPKPPDPYSTAAAQGAENMKASEASSIIGNPNESNPYGSVNYSTSGYETVYDAQGKPTQVPRYTRSVTLSPDQQQLLGLQTQTQKNLGQLAVDQSGRLQGLLSTNLNTEGLTPWTTVDQPQKYDPNAYAAQRDATTQALLDRYHAQTDPQRAAQEAQMASRGLAPGGQMYGTMQDAQNRADVDAANQAFLAGGQEQSRMLAEQRAGDQAQQSWAQFMNQTRGGELAERQTIRNAPINEIAALTSGSQVSVPQFQAYNAPSVASTPIGQYINDNYNARLQQAGATNAGIFGLGTSLVGGLFGTGGLFARA